MFVINTPMQTLDTASPVRRTEFGERIRALRRQLDVSQKIFAQHLGISQSTLSQVENGHHYPSIESLGKLIGELNINANWVLLGQGVPFPTPPELKERGQMIGIAHKALAGYSAQHRDELWLSAHERYRLPGFEDSRGYRIFQVLHTSMEPTLYDQDHIVARPIEDSPADHVGHVVVAVLDDEVLVKRLAGYEPSMKRFTLASDNPKFKTVDKGAGEVHELWLVMARLTRQLSPLIANQDYRLRQLEGAYQELSEKVESLMP